MAPAFDEMTLSDGASRAGYAVLKRWIEATARELLTHRRAEAELLFRRIGITFAVYGENDAEERIIPFDIIPRILTRAEWTRLSRAAWSSGSGRSTSSSPTSTARPRSSPAGVVPADLIYRNPVLPPGDGRAEAAARHLRPHRRHRHRPRRRPTTSTCSRTMPARPPASPTCWRTAK